MMQVVVAVFDRAANVFGRPFFVQAVGQAIRSFSDEVNRKDDQRSEFAKHPDDFDLWMLGLYDDGLGSFGGEQKMLVRAKAVVVKED